MSKTVAARIAFLAATLLPVVQAAYYYGRLPERIAVHFNAVGRPDRWDDKDGFMIVMALVLLALAASFAVIPLFLHRLPDNMINLSRKDYWLHPSRRAETLWFIERQLLWLGVCSMLLVSVIMQEVYWANLGPETGNLTITLWVVLAFIVGTVAWSVWMIRRFANPPSDDGSG